MGEKLFLFIKSYRQCWSTNMRRISSEKGFAGKFFGVSASIGAVPNPFPFSTLFIGRLTLSFPPSSLPPKFFPAHSGVLCATSSSSAAAAVVSNKLGLLWWLKGTWRYAYIGRVTERPLYLSLVLTVASPPSSLSGWQERKPPVPPGRRWRGGLSFGSSGRTNQ